MHELDSTKKIILTSSQAMLAQRLLGQSKTKPGSYITFLKILYDIINECNNSREIMSTTMKCFVRKESMG